jgi:hypothetical protein
VTSCGVQFVPTVLSHWQSPGGTLIALVATHSSSPKVTPLAVSALQLLKRHLELGVTYGGADTAAEIAGPIPQSAKLTRRYPRACSR